MIAMGCSGCIATGTTMRRYLPQKPKRFWPSDRNCANWIHGGLPNSSPAGVSSKTVAYFAVSPRSPLATFRVFSGGQVREGHYFEPAQWESQAELSVSDFRQAIQEALTCAVRRCVSPKTPVGVSLTGGFDTRLIMARLSAEQGLSQPIRLEGCIETVLTYKIAQEGREDIRM